MAEDGIREERYDLAIIRLGDLEIPCNDFKVSYKIKADRKYATNSYSPYGVGFSEEEISWEASETKSTRTRRLHQHLQLGW